MELLTPDLGFVFWHAIILLAAIILLGKFAWKPILGAIKSREKAYEEAVTQMKAAEKQVQQLHTQKEHIIEEANKESDRIIQQAIVSKEAILDEAETQAQHEKQRIMDHAMHTIALEKQAAQSAIKQETISLILHTTEKLIGRELSQGKAQQELIQGMLTEVEQSHEAR